MISLITIIIIIIIVSSQFDFFILAIDGLFNDSTNVTVIITDENDNAPIFNVTSPLTLYVLEEQIPQYYITTIYANDTDAPPLNNKAITSINIPYILE